MSILELELRHASQPLTDEWQRLPIKPRGSTLLGISYRPLQAVAFGLDAHATLRDLLAYPFQMIRLGAYWNRIEPRPGAFLIDELDWQIDAAERVGKKIILCVGPLKTFGYPEFFAPAHALKQPLAEHSRVNPSAYPSLLKAASEFITHVVEHYKHHESIVAWQLEHDAVDPLGMEHSWRLGAEFVRKEMEAVRMADSSRPVLMNGFLPTSSLVRFTQWWRTRDQGDSLTVAQRLADMIGVDYYPRNALLNIGRQTLYSDGSQSRWLQKKRQQLLNWAAVHGKQLLITEGQAEPWEAVTTPPNPAGQGMFSCLPEHIIMNYNAWMNTTGSDALYAYLFWGAEYWILRKQSGDSSYLQTFVRVLERV